MNRVTTASAMPTIPHKSHAGKNDPRMLNDGAREQPVSNNKADRQTAAVVTRSRIDFADVCLIFISGSLAMQQIASLVSQRGQSGKQIGAGGHVLAARTRQSALCRHHIDLTAQPVVI